MRMLIAKLHSKPVFNKGWVIQIKEEKEGDVSNWDFDTSLKSSVEVYQLHGQPNQARQVTTKNKNIS